MAFFITFAFKLLFMAGKSKTSTAQIKTSFGKKITGVAKKNYSKYEEKPKKYKGQGR